MAIHLSFQRCVAALICVAMAELVTLPTGVTFAEMPYEANWESLEKHTAAPEWFQDAKLGIYFHWGVYTVPARYSEWYARSMFFTGGKAFKYHVKHYDHPSIFGYHDFVPMFKAEHFDPDEWMDLFEKAGAKFVGPVAEHHDGFSMWDSDITPWNAADRGPKRDITGELARAARARGLKFITTFHHARNLQRYRDGYREEYMREPDKNEWSSRTFWNSHYPYIPGGPTASCDPDLRLLYGNVPEDEWCEKVWLGKLKEVIDQYQPDIMWFDSWLDKIPESYRQRFCAYYLNEAKKWNKEVVIVRKQSDLPLEMSVNDHEKSREPHVSPVPWMTDDTISTGSWCYTEGLKIKPLDKVIHSMVDTVSKNGILLLNISPKSNGVIPQDQRDVLAGLGHWLQANGAAIYATRPWYTAGEGPTQEPTGGFGDAGKFGKLKYSAKDIRFTRTQDRHKIFATFLGSLAGQSPVQIKSFATDKFQDIPQVKAVRLLNGATLTFKQTAQGLSIHLPDNIVWDPSANVIEIEVDSLGIVKPIDAPAAK